MPIIDPPIETVVLINRSSGENRLIFESPLCSPNHAAELWWEVNSSHYVLFQQDEYYDDTLRNRRNADNMLSPRDPHIRLVYVASVWGLGSFDGTQWLQISRCVVAPTA